jgi:HD-GYP domain-containing protein (c-di-GMP phosphodiesterase class II)
MARETEKLVFQAYFLNQTPRVETMVSDQDLYQARLNFVFKLSVLIRATKIYAPENTTIRKHFEECLYLIWEISKWEKRLCLKVMMDAVFVNEQRVRVNRGTYPSVKLVMEELKHRMIGEILFRETVSTEDLSGFMYLLAADEWRRDSAEHPLTTELNRKGIFTIAVKPFDPVLHDERLRKKEAKKIYFRSINMVKEVCQNLLEDRPLALRKAKRLTQSMVDLLLYDKVALHGLSTVKNYDEYTYNHCVNVCIYALTLGAKLGLGKKLLAELGLSALFHDVGKVNIPDEILKKPDKLNEVEWEVIKSHPMTGVEEILAFHQFAEVHPRILFGIFDHHLNFNTSGYPSLKRKKRQTLFGKIVAIADVYDALTTPRCYRKRAYSPTEALKIMWTECGARFDPALFKVFVNAIGVFPVGSLVQLDNGELGVVSETNQNPKFVDRPRVVTIAGPGDGKKTIDLSERDEKNQGFRRSVVRCLDPKKYDISVQEYVL